MSKRKFNEISGTLTYKHLHSINVEELRLLADKNERAFLASFRKKAKKEKWDAELIICSSITNPRNGKTVRLHHHYYLSGTPASTIEDYIKGYWEDRHGFASKEWCYDKQGFLSYMIANRPLTFREQQFKYAVEDNCDQVLTLATSNNEEHSENTDTQITSRLGTCLYRDSVSIKLLPLLKVFINKINKISSVFAKVRDDFNTIVCQDTIHLILSG